ncbi:MAG: PDGLE domain-containing protein [Candidatus Bathyarchaeia archaeon]
MKGYFKALIIVLLAFAVLAPFASTYPDGLETVVETLKVEEAQAAWEGLMPDYTLPNVENQYFSTLTSGFIGTFIVLAAAFIIGKTLEKPKA